MCLRVSGLGGGAAVSALLNITLTSSLVAPCVCRGRIARGGFGKPGSELVRPLFSKIFPGWRTIQLCQGPWWWSPEKLLHRMEGLVTTGGDVPQEKPLRV